MTYFIPLTICYITLASGKGGIVSSSSLSFLDWNKKKTLAADGGLRWAYVQSRQAADSLPPLKKKRFGEIEPPGTHTHKGRGVRGCSNVLSPHENNMADISRDASELSGGGKETLSRERVNHLLQFPQPRPSEGDENKRNSRRRKFQNVRGAMTVFSLPDRSGWPFPSRFCWLELK